MSIQYIQHKIAIVLRERRAVLGYMLLVISLLITWNANLLGQYKFNQSTIYDEEDGLPSRLIYNIQKGADGFLWLTTSEGLCRFDGVSFKTYQHDAENANSIIDNRTGALLVLKDKIWIGSVLGLSILDLKTEQFTNYELNIEGKTDTLSGDRRSEIRFIFQDSEGDIWIATRYLGTFRFIPEEDNFKPYTFKGTIDEDLFPTIDDVHNIRCFVQEPGVDTILWAGTDNGLLEINKRTTELTLHHFPYEDPTVRRRFNRFIRMIVHKGRFYIGGYGPDLRVFDPQTKTLQEVEIKKHPDEGILREEGLMRFVEKSEDALWISRVKGLVELNTDRNEITLVKKNDFKNGIHYNAVCKDTSGRVWGRSRQGLHLFDPFLQQYEIHSFEHLNSEKWGFVFSMVQPPNTQQIFVLPRDANGLFELDKGSGNWKKTTFPPAGYEKNVFSRASDLVLDPNGNLTIASVYGFFTYDLRRKQYSSLAFQPDLEYDYISTTLWDSKGQFWVAASTEGLLRWNPETNEVQHFVEELAVPEYDIHAHAGNHLFEDSKGNIWSRRNKGLSVYIAEKDTIVNLLAPINPENTFSVVYNFAEDQQGRVWMTSEENLIGYADVDHPEKGVVEKVDLKEYGVGGGVYMVRTDLEGHLWLTNIDYLVEIDPRDSFTVTLHNHQYGRLKAESFSFEVLPDGELAFGERNFICYAKPEALERNTALPIPYITEIQVLNEPYQSDTAAFYKHYLKLKHNENFFSIRFSAQSARLGKENRFQYRLKGFEDWVEAEGRHFANYTNVPSGNYVFQLQVANNEGLWNPKFCELRIEILTPWWATWYFRAFIVIVLGSFIYGIYRYRLSQVKQRERLKTAFNKKLANVEMTALRAQMNPHFLFNSLNSIDSYIVKNKSVEASEYLNNFARLMRLILQNSRSNYVSLADELEALELYIQMESLRFKDKFKYKIDISEALDISSIDIPPMLIQPYVENAIWHGLMNKKDRSNSLLSIHIYEEKGILYCLIEDNGVGRKRAKEIAANKMSVKKRSMGMTITRDRIELINQLYNLNAKVGIKDLVDANGIGCGTRITLEIPI